METSGCDWREIHSCHGHLCLYCFFCTQHINVNFPRANVELERGSDVNEIHTSYVIRLEFLRALQ